MTRSELEKLHRFLILARNTSIFPALILTILSVSTLFWAKTTGTILTAERERLTFAGDAVANGYHGRYGGEFHWVKAKYSYKVDGNDYESGLICICLPIGFQLSRPGADVEMYYAPLIPSLSVLYRTPDFLLIALLLMLGAGANVAAQRLRSLQSITPL